MNVKDVFKSTLQLSTTVVKKYTDDLTDADLLRRPAPGCNHIAWQLGHVIASQHSLLNAVRPNSAPALPDGFAEQHSKETAGSDDPTSFRTKQEYIELFDQMNAAAMALIDAFPEADLDGPSPEGLRKMFPTMGSLFILVATHPMMHAGQFVPVRRILGKPVVI